MYSSKKLILAAAAILALSLSACGESMDYYPLTATTRAGAVTSPPETDPPKDSSGTTSTAPPETSKQTETSVTPVSDQDNDRAEPSPLSDEEYLENSLFIGDSICSGLSAYLDDYVSGENVLAYRDGRTTNMFSQTYEVNGKAKALDEAFEEISPDFVYFWLGTNEFSSLSGEKFSEYYQKLIDDVTASDRDVKIGIISIAPTGKGYPVTPEKVSELNDSLEKLAKEMGGKTVYIDVTGVLADDSGFLKKEYDTGDGLHINQKGYKAVSEYILSNKM